MKRLFLFITALLTLGNAMMNIANSAFSGCTNVASVTFCEDCPAVEVTKGTKTIKLYNPEKVEFKKE